MGFLIGKWWSMWIQRYRDTEILEYKSVGISGCYCYGFIVPS